MDSRSNQNKYKMGKLLAFPEIAKVSLINSDKTYSDHDRRLERIRRSIIAIQAMMKEIRSLQNETNRPIDLTETY